MSGSYLADVAPVCRQRLKVSQIVTRGAARGWGAMSARTALRACAASDEEAGRGRERNRTGAGGPGRCQERQPALIRRGAKKHLPAGMEYCDRCGGVGGAEFWPGYTCFKCEGHGWVEPKGDA